jgi:hypothetical protein
VGQRSAVHSGDAPAAATCSPTPNRPAVSRTQPSAPNKQPAALPSATAPAPPRFAAPSRSLPRAPATPRARGAAKAARAGPPAPPGSTTTSARGIKQSGISPLSLCNSLNVPVLLRHSVTKQAMSLLIQVPFNPGQFRSYSHGRISIAQPMSFPSIDQTCQFLAFPPE